MTPGIKAFPSTSGLQIPPGLDATTADKISQLAKLLTTSQDQPYPNQLTSKVLPAHLKAKRTLPPDYTQLGLTEGTAAPESLRQ